VNVTWIAGNVACRLSCNGRVNRVHTYCGLEIAVIAMSANISCIRRGEKAPEDVEVITLVMADSEYNYAG
jgi:hypothetical protein